MKDDWPWITDALRELSDMDERRMFGCLAFYRFGKLALVLTGEGDEPWNGVCACTEREYHASLLAEFPALKSHPVLGKWLYVSCEDPAFEKTVLRLIALIAAGDARLGVTPKPKRRKASPGRPVVKKQKIR
jgi:hypothetical protein